MTLRIHEEPETGTAKLLRASIADRRTDLAIAALQDSKRSVTDTVRAMWLKSARKDIDLALAALEGEPSC